jgi:hypothetical protein
VQVWLHVDLFAHTTHSSHASETLTAEDTVIVEMLFGYDSNGDGEESEERNEESEERGAYDTGRDDSESSVIDVVNIDEDAFSEASSVHAPLADVTARFRERRDALFEYYINVSQDDGAGLRVVRRHWRDSTAVRGFLHMLQRTMLHETPPNLTMRGVLDYAPRAVLMACRSQLFDEAMSLLGLIGTGSSIYIVDDKGLNALMYACMHEHLLLASALLRCGAVTQNRPFDMINAHAHGGVQAVHICIYLDNLPLEELLRVHGACPEGDFRTTAPLLPTWLAEILGPSPRETRLQQTMASNARNARVAQSAQSMQSATQREPLYDEFHVTTQEMYDIHELPSA